MFPHFDFKWESNHGEIQTLSLSSIVSFLFPLLTLSLSSIHNSLFFFGSFLVLISNFPLSLHLFPLPRFPCLTCRGNSVSLMTGLP